MTSDSPQPQEGYARKHKWIVGGLIVSVAFNLFTLGALASIGRSYERHYGEFREIVNALPDEVHDDLRSKMRARRKEFRQLRRSMRENVRESVQALSAPLAQERFGRAEAERILERIQKSMTEQSSTLIRNSWKDALDVIEKMDIKDRRKLSEKIEDLTSMLLEEEMRFVRLGDGRGFLATPTPHALPMTGS